MKNFENLNLGLFELDAREMVELEGGVLPAIWGAFALGVGIGLGGYIASEILDGVLRYADGERIRK